MKLKKFLVSIDLLSYQPTFFISGKDRYKNLCGGLLVILLIISYLLIFIYFAQDIFYRQNPLVIPGSSIDNNASNVTLKPTDFSVVFALIDQITLAPYIDESIYTVEFYRTTISNSIIAERTLLKMVRCSLDNFEGVDENIFPFGFPFQDYYCIDKNEALIIKGSISSEDFSYIEGQIKMCNNATSNGSCASQETLDLKLNGVTTYLYYIDKYLDLNNYDKPINQFFKQYVATASMLTYTVLDISMKQIQFSDDIGFLTTDKVMNHVLAVDVIIKQIDFRPSDHFIDIVLHYGSNVDIYNRQYKKVQQAVAETGGMLSILKLIFGRLISLYSEIKYFTFLSGLFFNFPQISEKTNQRKSSENKLEILKKTFFDKNIQKLHSSIRDKVAILRPASLKKKLGIMLDQRKAVKKMKELIDPQQFLKLIKEIRLMKILLIENDDLSTFDKLIKDKNQSNLLLISMNDFIGKYAKIEENKEFPTTISEKLKKISRTFNI